MSESKFLDSFVFKLNLNRSQILEERISIVLRPKPMWMPLFVYRRLVSLLICIQYRMRTTHDRINHHPE